MKQKQLDQLARLDYEDEKHHIKRLKAFLNCDEYWNVVSDSRRKSMLMQLSYHKKRLMYYKRKVPMYPRMCYWYYCSTCDARLYTRTEHCPRCGQRFMWPEED